MKKKQSPSIDGIREEVSTPNDRVRWILAAFFGGNKSKMARSLGLSHTLVNKVVADEQEPGRRFVAAAIEKLGINPGWMLSGAGEPICGTRQEVPTDGWPVPVSSALLPGPLADNRHLLTDAVQLVPGVLFDETAYVFDLPPTHPLVVDTLHRMQPHDRILLYTDPTRWRRNIGVLDGKYCGVLRKSLLHPHHDLGKVSCRRDGTGKLTALVAGFATTWSATQPPAADGQPLDSKEVIDIEDVVSMAAVLIRQL
jgi:hypothetical protein